MPDRLNELVRQRALVSEHLAWLDREIARANSSPAPAPVPIEPIAPVPSGAPAAAIGTAPATSVPDATLSAASSTPAITPADAPAALTEEILDQYRVSPQAVHQDVRKGCFLYFAGAFVVLGIVIAILYFTISSK